VLRKLLILALVAVGLVGLTAAATLVALEGNEVAVLRTVGSSGDVQDARVWVADAGGETWIEVASPDKEFYRRMLANPRVELVRGGETRVVRAMPEPSRAAHDRIRMLLAGKYGLADRWIGLLVDVSGSIAVRLAPIEETR
jgi:hypothetical protein